MPDLSNSPKQPGANLPPKNPTFTSRPLEQPMFSSEMKSKIAASAAQVSLSQGGFKDFYRNNKVYFWAIFAGLVIIAFLSYAVFHTAKPTPAKEAQINISIEAPTVVASGGEEIYKITLDNKDSQKLTGLQLEVAYPEGISYEGSSPSASNLSGTLFPVPDLIPGQNAVVILKARVTGNVNDTKNLTTRLHYRYSNLSSDFVKQQDFSVRLVASDIALNLTGPTNANNGQLVIYTLNYQNNSDGAAQNARITMEYPAGFAFASANPKPDLGNNTWNIGTLGQNASSTIQIQGSFNSVNPGESVTAVANFLILGNDGNYFMQNSSSIITAIANQPLLITQSVNSPSTNIINPGDTLTYTLKYQNNASVAANGVNVVATLDASALDLSTIQAEGGQVNNNTITWNASSASQLQLLAPNEGGNLRFTVRVKNPATKDSSTNLTVVNHIKIGSNEYTTFFPGSDLTLKISSPSGITANLTYVSGQLPPKVGTNTTYKVTFTLRNATNDYSNTIVTAFIPLGAGGFSQGSVTLLEQKNVTFDPSSGKLTWNVGALAAHIGQFSQAKTLEFNVNLNPSANQAHQSPVLVKTIALDATDLFTSAHVHDTATDINTSNVQGQSGYGYGTVSE